MRKTKEKKVSFCLETEDFEVATVELLSVFLLEASIKSII